MDFNDIKQLSEYGRSGDVTFDSTTDVVKSVKDEYNRIITSKWQSPQQKKRQVRSSLKSMRFLLRVKSISADGKKEIKEIIDKLKKHK